MRAHLLDRPWTRPLPPPITLSRPVDYPPSTRPSPPLPYHPQAAAAVAGVKCTYVHELLDYEARRGIHKLGTASDGSGAVLGNPSGAIAVLWIRRLLQFSAVVLQIVLEGQYIDVAMEQAYGDVLRPFHGWMLRKVPNAARTLYTHAACARRKHKLIPNLQPISVPGKVPPPCIAVPPISAAWPFHSVTSTCPDGPTRMCLSPVL